MELSGKLITMIKKIISKFFNHSSQEGEADFMNCPVDVSELDGVRSMHIGSDTIQSSMSIQDPFFLELDYTKVMSLCFAFNTNPKEILVVGLGGGSMPKFFYRHAKQSNINVLELNAQVIQVVRCFFNIPESKRFNIIEGDGIAFMEKDEKQYDILLSDAFDDISLPEVFCTMEYFSLCKSRLSPQGIFIINLWGSDPKTMLFIDRIKLVFEGRVLFSAAGNPGNIIIFAFNSEPLELRVAPLKLRIKELEKRFGFNLMVYFNRLTESNSATNARRIKFE